MPKAKRAGFTLIELLVVVVIIGILASVATSAFRDAQDRSRNSSMISIVRTVQLGIEQWRTDFSGIPQELVKAGNTNPGEALAADPGSKSSWKMPDNSPPQQYVPGFVVPRTPWAKESQGVTVSGFNFEDGKDIPAIKDLLDGKPISAAMPDGILIDGGDADGMPPPGPAPSQRNHYGYIYYTGDNSSGRYVVAGAGKMKKNAYIVGLKSNF
jgi:prepilin-type N-terminal cleavage/methylation domain-containing protein